MAAIAVLVVQPASSSLLLIQSQLSIAFAAFGIAAE